jgi:hypothetical protein
MVVDPTGDFPVLGARLEAAYREGVKSNNCPAGSRVISGLPAKLRYGAPQTSTTGESTSVGWNSPSGRTIVSSGFCFSMGGDT